MLLYKATMQTKTIAQLAAADSAVEVVLTHSRGETILSAFECVSAGLGHIELAASEICTAPISDSELDALVGISDSWHK